VLARYVNAEENVVSFGALRDPTGSGSLSPSGWERVHNRDCDSEADSAPNFSHPMGYQGHWTLASLVSQVKRPVDLLDLYTGLRLKAGAMNSQIDELID
jgi:hypothetical protein